MQNVTNSRQPATRKTGIKNRPSWAKLTRDILYVWWRRMAIRLQCFIIKYQHEKIRALDICMCNGGGHTYLSRIGVETVVGVEIDKMRGRWAQERFPGCKVIIGDISDEKIIKEAIQTSKALGVNAITISCPCQDASLANSKRDASSTRNGLYESALRIVKGIQPDLVLWENVPQWLDSKPSALKGKTISEYIIKEHTSMGFSVNKGIQDAANFLVPMHRRRGLLLCSRVGEWNFPKPEKVVVTLRMAIGWMQSLVAGQVGRRKNHVAPHLSAPQVEVMAHTPSGMSAHDNPEPWKPCNVDGSPSKARFKCSFQRKDPDDASNTILCDSKGVSGFRTIHFGRKRRDGTFSDARAMTVAELLKISDLPKSFFIPDWASDTLVRTCIGEQFAATHLLRLMMMVPRKKRN